MHKLCHSAWMYSCCFTCVLPMCTLLTIYGPAWTYFLHCSWQYRHAHAKYTPGHHTTTSNRNDVWRRKVRGMTTCVLRRHAHAVSNRDSARD